MCDVKALRDLCYATVDGVDLCLDLYIPSTPDPAIVVYAHGGGFQLGDKADAEHTRLRGLAGHGVAVASIDYRHAPRYLLPAQVEDMTAAVRWLRANAGGYGLSAERIGVWGASAGGYLASMVALSGGAQAAVVWFAPADLASSGARSPLEQQILFPSFEAAALGVDAAAHAPADSSVLARVASSAAAPPFLLAHGDRDRVVPFAESAALHDALGRAGIPSTLLSVAGAGHEDPAFDRPDLLAMTAGWLNSVLHRPQARTEGTR